MKEESRTAVKHEHEHEAPIVIHNPEEDLTILAKWLHRGMKQGAKFWVLVAAVVALFVAAPFIVGGLTSGQSASSKGWSELMLATTPGQKVEVADEFPNTEVATAARLQAATYFFTNAVRSLPNDIEVAKPELNQALDLFQRVANESPKDSAAALAGTFGAARTLEARNELADAVSQYKAVIAGWPGSPEAKQAEKLIKKLQDPEVIAFYKQLHSYKPPTAPSPLPGLGDLPGFNTSRPVLGGLPAGHPALNGPTVPAGPLPPSVDALPALPAVPGAGPTDIAPPPNLPGPSQPIEKGATPKAPDTTRPSAGKSDAKSELPADVFAPSVKPKL